MPNGQRQLFQAQESRVAVHAYNNATQSATNTTDTPTVFTVVLRS